MLLTLYKHIQIVKWEVPQIAGLSPDRLTLKSYFGDGGAQILRTL